MTHLVANPSALPKVPRSHTVCNISKLPKNVRKLVADALFGRTFLEADSIELENALKSSGDAVLTAVTSQSQFYLGQLC